MNNIDFFKKINITSHLSSNELDDLLKNIIIKNYKENDLIINKDEKTNGLFFIKSGFVKFLKEKEDQELLRILTVYDYFGIISLLNNTIQNEYIYAKDNVTLVFLPENIIKKYIISNPDANRHLTYLLKKRLTSKPDIFIGQNINHFIILEEINKKSNSILYKGIHQELFYNISIKILSEELSTNKNFAENFIKTRKELTSFNHMHILEIYDAGYYKNKLYCIKEYMQGDLLESHLRNPKKLNSINDKIKIINQLAKALEHIHSYNIIHANLTPSHIILDNDNNIKLFGFGLTLFEQEKHNNYDSPEKKANEILTLKSDLYSFGIIAYKILTGKLPLDKQILLEKDFPLISKDLITFINKCINVDKDIRPCSFKELSLNINEKIIKVSDKKLFFPFLNFFAFLILLSFIFLFFLKNTNTGQKLAYKFLFYKPEKNLNQDILNEAIKLYEKEDYFNAIEKFNIILKNDENNKEAEEYINLCKIAIELNEYNK